MTKQNIISYPKLKRDDWNSVKIKDEDVLVIRKMREQKFTFEQIAEIFHVSIATIYYHSSEDAKRTQLAHNRELEVSRENDPEFRLKKRERDKRRSVRRKERVRSSGYNKQHSQIVRKNNNYRPQYYSIQALQNRDERKLDASRKSEALHKKQHVIDSRRWHRANSLYAFRSLWKNLE